MFQGQVLIITLPRDATVGRLSEYAAQDPRLRNSLLQYTAFGFTPVNKGPRITDYQRVAPDHKLVSKLVRAKVGQLYLVVGDKVPFCAAAAGAQNVAGPATEFVFSEKHVGMRAKFTLTGELVTIRFVGNTLLGEGVWIGFEHSTPTALTRAGGEIEQQRDGSVVQKGGKVTTYFTCTPGHGGFAPARKFWVLPYLRATNIRTSLTLLLCLQRRAVTADSEAFVPRFALSVRKRIFQMLAQYHTLLRVTIYHLPSRRMRRRHNGNKLKMEQRRRLVQVPARTTLQSLAIQVKAMLDPRNSYNFTFYKWTRSTPPPKRLDIQAGTALGKKTITLYPQHSSPPSSPSTRTRRHSETQIFTLPYTHTHHQPLPALQYTCTTTSGTGDTAAPDPHVFHEMHASAVEDVEVKTSQLRNFGAGARLDDLVGHTFGLEGDLVITRPSLRRGAKDIGEFMLGDIDCSGCTVALMDRLRATPGASFASQEGALRVPGHNKTTCMTLARARTRT